MRIASRLVLKRVDFATLSEASEISPFRRLIIQSQIRMHVIELGHGVCSAVPIRLHGRNPGENLKSRSQETGCEFAYGKWARP